MAAHHAAKRLLLEPHHLPCGRHPPHRDGFPFRQPGALLPCDQCRQDYQPGDAHARQQQDHPALHTHHQNHEGRQMCGVARGGARRAGLSTHLRTERAAPRTAMQHTDRDLPRPAAARRTGAVASAHHRCRLGGHRGQPLHDHVRQVARAIPLAPFWIQPMVQPCRPPSNLYQCLRNTLWPLPSCQHPDQRIYRRLPAAAGLLPVGAGRLAQADCPALPSRKHRGHHHRCQNGRGTALCQRGAEV